MSIETRETKLFWRDIPGFCRDIPDVPEKFEKKRFVFNFRSLLVPALFWNSRFEALCLSEEAIALSVTLSGGALFVS